MKTYRFESKNLGAVNIEVVGVWRDGSKDLCAYYSGKDDIDGNDREFIECDDADEIMQWLVDEGVEFYSRRSMAFSRAYIQQVLIDGDTTEDELLYALANWTDGQIEAKLQSIC